MMSGAKCFSYKLRMLSNLLSGVSKFRFNVRQSLSAETHLILQLLVSTPIKHFLCIIADIIVFGSNFHRAIADFFFVVREVS